MEKKRKKEERKETSHIEIKSEEKKNEDEKREDTDLWRTGEGLDIRKKSKQCQIKKKKRGKLQGSPMSSSKGLKNRVNVREKRVGCREEKRGGCWGDKGGDVCITFGVNYLICHQQGKLFPERNLARRDQQGRGCEIKRKDAKWREV